MIPYFVFKFLIIWSEDIAPSLAAVTSCFNFETRTSPMAKTPLIIVSMFSSTSIKPLFIFKLMLRRKSSTPFSPVYGKTPITSIFLPLSKVKELTPSISPLILLTLSLMISILLNFLNSSRSFLFISSS